MTYDKVQFAMNRYQMTADQGTTNSGTVANTTTSGLESNGERVSILSSRPKRTSTAAQDPQLYDITETEEPIKSIDEKSTDLSRSIDGQDQTDGNVHWRSKSLDAFRNTNGNDHGYGKAKHSTHPVNKTVSHGYEPECENLSDFSIKRQEAGTKRYVDTVNKDLDDNSYKSPQQKSKLLLHSTQTSEGSVPSIDILNMGNEYRSRKKKNRSDEGTNFINERSNKVKTNVDITKQTSNIAPSNFSISCGHKRDERLKKTLKWKTGKERDLEKCVICELTDATAKYASVESDKLLVEIVYPHEFYDRFSRSGKRSNTDPRGAKEPIAICKPVKVARKTERRRSTSSPILTNRNAPPNTFRDDTIGDAEFGNEGLNLMTNVPEKRRKTQDENESGFKKEIHLQCKPKSNALVITDSTQGQKIVIKGLKGWILKKDVACKNKIHKEIKQSLYQVNSLGMQFSIPEHNDTLHNRAPTLPQSSRNMTSLNSSFTIDTSRENRNHKRGHYTQGLGPRQPTFSTPRDLQMTPPRGIMGIQRSVTTMPKIMSQTIRENSYKMSYSQQTGSSAYSSSLRTSTQSSTKEKLSLPPIGQEVHTLL